MKKCGKCLEIKEELDFNKNKKKKDGVSSICKECHSTYRREHYLKNKEKVISQVNEYRLNNPEIYSSKSRKMNVFSKKAGRTIEVKCSNCNNIVYQSKNDLLLEKKTYCSKECKSIDNKSLYYLYLKQVEKRAIKSNKEFNLSEDFIKDLLENKQDNKCNITNINIKLNQKNTSSTLHESASLDRIKSDKGYTEDNVQWVCLGINYMKLDYSDDDLHLLLKLIKDNYTGMV
jgi:hypothetical protein